MGRIGTTELILIIVVMLLLFGAKRIPDIARSIGKSMNQFKQGLKDIDIDEPSEQNDTHKMSEE